MKRIVQITFLLILFFFTHNLRAEIIVPNDLGTALNLGTAPNEWKFIPGDNLDYRLPEWDDSSWETVASLPHNWKDPAVSPHSNSNFAWYRIHLRIPEKHNYKPLMFRIGPVDDADEVFFNGQLIGKSGEIAPGKNRPTISAYDKVRLYPVPLGSIKPGQDNVLAIRVQALFADYAGFDLAFCTVFLGQEKKILESFFMENLVIFFIVAIFLMVAYFYLFLYFKKAQLYENLFFGLTSLWFAAYFFLRTQIKYYFFEDYYIMKRIEYIFLFTMIYLFMNFIYFYYAKTEKKFAKIEKKIIQINNVIALCFIAVPLVSNDSTTWFRFYITVVQPLWIIPLAFAAWTLIKNALRKNRDAIYMLLGFLPGLAALFNDVLVNRGLLTWGRIGHFGFFAFLITYATILANHFVSLSDEVEELNLGLENKVTERTGELEATVKEMELMNKALVDTNLDLERVQRIVNKDMMMATNVQASLFPELPPRSKEWDIAFLYKPMSGVSGDFYDFYQKDETLTGLSLLDVSGHGIASALITMIAKPILFRNFHRNRDKPLNAIIEKTNTNLIAEIDSVDNYLTGIFLRFNNNTVEYVNAGHPPLLSKSGSSGKITIIDSIDPGFKGALLGIQKVAGSFGKIEFSMAQGDIILLYSDCLTESMNSQDISFNERLISSFEKAPAGSAKQVLDHIVHDFYDFLGGEKLDDDLTVIAVKRIV
ncbi:MAG: SpoIIE family protein phosphatase [bacterium]|nr:SpoIIE family protein phosphatase [bacterium]